MNKEEKEAIKEVKSYIEWVKDRGTDTDKHIEIILNLIDRLEKQLDQLKEVDKQICNEELITKDKYQEILKENEELKEELEKCEQLVGFTTIRIKPEDIKVVTDKFISKDIIKKLIEDKKQIGTYNIEYLKIEDLEELLGE